METPKTSEQWAAEIKGRLQELDIERARLALALDALAPTPADRMAKARAAKAAKRKAVKVNG